MLLKEYNKLWFFLKEINFLITYNPKEEKIIKDIRNLFRLKKEQNHAAIKDIRNLFRQEKETKEIQDRILRDIKNLFEHEKEQQE